MPKGLHRPTRISGRGRGQASRQPTVRAHLPSAAPGLWGVWLTDGAPWSPPFPRLVAGPWERSWDNVGQSERWFWAGCLL